ncbi:hypothetical protein RvY_06440 [Ramazzottius varieornatus]|uniref:Uncharacterized protein n=1 Tax=Ramazzottius varieornatus TaxID=947166 RepID=A0A1D1UYK2_RAMVA|nr:hypothetical protein RvY_06440 [Ramazzottius varieornatus]
MAASSSDVKIDVGVLAKVRLRKRPPATKSFEDQYGLQIALVAGTFSLIFCLACGKTLGLWVTLLGGWFGDQDAQYMAGQKYLQGDGTVVNHRAAMYWFHKAALQGHPEAAYNLGYGHVHRLHSHLAEGEAEGYIRKAAQADVKEAKHTLKYLCGNGFCKL